jgi:peptidoglycan/LPS O-acetylase OafA/YrhL
VGPFGPARPQGELRARLDRLTSLRWFAAFGVFLVHAYQLDRVVIPWYTRSAEAGGEAGVAFFFMLSGFVLAWSHSDARGRKPFWQNRFARIWPSHITAVVAALLLPWIVDGVRPELKLVPPVVLLVQAWIPSQHWYFAPNIVAWTLSCEAFFYAVFPWLHRAVDQVRRPVVLLAGLLLLVWVIPTLTFPFNAAHTEWIAYICPLSRLPEFCIGIVLCRTVREGRLRWSNPYIPAAWAIAAIMVARWIPHRYIYAAWPTIPLAWLLAASAARAARPGERRRSLLETRPFIWLGELSFVFYLVHALVLRWSVPTIGWLRHGELSHPRVLFVEEIVGSIVVAFVVHQVIEVPFERWLRAAHSRRLSEPGTADDDDGLTQPDERAEMHQ